MASKLDAEKSRLSGVTGDGNLNDSRHRPYVKSAWGRSVGARPRGIHSLCAQGLKQRWGNGIQLGPARNRAAVPESCISTHRTDGVTNRLWQYSRCVTVCFAPRIKDAPVDPPKEVAITRAELALLGIPFPVRRNVSRIRSRILGNARARGIRNEALPMIVIGGDLDCVETRESCVRDA
jgi:hypothetical protein